MLSVKTSTIIVNQADAAINSTSVAVVFHARATVVDVTGAAVFSRLMAFSSSVSDITFAE